MEMTVILAACVAPSQLGPEINKFNKETQCNTLAHTDCNVMWLAAKEVVDSMYTTIWSFCWLYKMHVPRKEMTNEKLAALTSDGNCWMIKRPACDETVQFTRNYGCVVVATTS